MHLRFIAQIMAEQLFVRVDKLRRIRFKPLCHASRRHRTVIMQMALDARARIGNKARRIDADVRVTVVERDPDVIALFQEELLPQFPNGEKITVVQDDAFTFAEKRLPDFGADFVFVDLWHDTADGAEMYLRMKKFERRTGAPFAYWIEPSIVALIRGLAHDDAETGRAWAERLLKSGARVEDAAADWLTFDMIR